MTKLNAKSKFGDFLVAFRLATRKELASALQSTQPTQMLGQVMVQKGFMTREVCEQVANIQRLYQKTAAKLAKEDLFVDLDEKSFVGDIMVALGFVTPAQNKEWLDYQSTKRANGEDPGRLGELFVNNGVCNALERDLAMQVQNWLRGVK
jgi:hypothetical protein